MVGETGGSAVMVTDAEILTPSICSRGRKESSRSRWRNDAGGHACYVRRGGSNRMSPRRVHYATATRPPRSWPIASRRPIKIGRALADFERVVAPRAAA